MPTLVNFAYTGAAVEVVVPAGVEGAVLTCVGARGGGANNTQYGMGASIQARIEDLMPGESLFVIVGGVPPSSYVGGYPDGGNVIPQGGTIYVGMAGGGSTAICRGSTSDYDRILVGGAGGGRSPRSGYQKGGNGGHPEGARGNNFGGYGGTQSAGGSNGGSFGQGGSGIGSGTRTGGGGGGGWYGGGGGVATSGNNPPGGGGSSYYEPSLTLISAQTNAEANNEGNGSASILWDDPVNIADIQAGPATVEAVGGVSVVPGIIRPRRELVWVHGLNGTRRVVLD